MIGRMGGVGEGWRVGVVQGAPSAVGAGVLGAAGVVRRVLLNAAWCPKNLCARTTQPRRERGGRGRNGGGGGPTRSGERGAAVGGGRGRGGARGGAEAKGRGRASHQGEKMAENSRFSNSYGGSFESVPRTLASSCSSEVYEI